MDFCYYWVTLGAIGIPAKRDLLAICVNNIGDYLTNCVRKPVRWAPCTYNFLPGSFRNCGQIWNRSSPFWLALSRCCRHWAGTSARWLTAGSSLSNQRREPQRNHQTDVALYFNSRYNFASDSLCTVDSFSTAENGAITDATLLKFLSELCINSIT